MNHPVDPISDGLTPPAPPSELRLHTLQAARKAMTENGRDDIWWRLWDSRPMRFAWASSVAAVLFGHIVIGSGTHSGPANTIRPMMAAAGAAGELAEIIDMKRVTFELPGWETEVSWDQVETEQPTTDEDQS
jgi:hypothetical protein